VVDLVETGLDVSLDDLLEPIFAGGFLAVFLRFPPETPGS
jgi:hypothetical protein